MVPSAQQQVSIIMQQQQYRALLELIRSREEPNSVESSGLVLYSGRAIPVTEDTSEQILGMSVTLTGVNFLLVISLAGYTAYPEIGLRSSAIDLLRSISMYNPGIFASGEELIASGILGE